MGAVVSFILRFFFFRLCIKLGFFLFCTLTLLICLCFIENELWLKLESQLMAWRKGDCPCRRVAVWKTWVSRRISSLKTTFAFTSVCTQHVYLKKFFVWCSPIGCVCGPLWGGFFDVIHRTGGSEQSLQLMLLVHGYGFGQKSLGPFPLP